MTLDHVAQSGQHPHADRGADLYSTPAVAVEALLRAEQLPSLIWEPCAGRGGIARVLRAAGYTVITSDICSYDFPLDFESDFLAMTEAPAAEIVAIVTNPPFMLAEKFVAHAFELVPHVIMLCRLAFLESERRAPILDTGKLACVHVFKRRLPMMHRDNWTGPRASSAMAFAWFVWNRDHSGPATVDRISWKDW
jgi:hypothetical protein